MPGLHIGIFLIENLFEKMTNKIALVTCYFIRNYGSQLQALATQIAVQKIGYECEHICIDGLLPEINDSRKKFFLRNFFNYSVWSDKVPALKRMIFLKTIGRNHVKFLALRTKMFDHFSREHFIISEKYENKSRLTSAAHKYNAFIVGSDQLWLPSNIAGDYYTLNFVPDDIKKISLATSFGVASLPKKEAKMANEFLNRIDYVSVREHSGKELIKQVAGRDVPVVCDPTLMLTAEDWEKLIPKECIENDKYIFCYLLGNHPEQRAFIKQISKHIGFKIVQIHSGNSFMFAEEGFADEQMFEAGPSEFLRMIRDAEYVFTDSFHCTVFSLQFKKDFYVFRRFTTEGKTSTNGRIYSLLDVVSLQDRMLTGREDVEKVLGAEIDYTAVHKALADFRQFTWNWLENALKS